MTLIPLRTVGDGEGDGDGGNGNGRQKMLNQILERLQADLLACDAQWTMFVAAAHGYRYESLLLNLAKDMSIDGICEAIAEVPRLEYVLQQLKLGFVKCFSWQVLKILYTVLVEYGERVTLSTLRPCEFRELYEHLQMPAPKIRPTQIYEVLASGKAYAELRESQKYPIRLGFYGGKLDNLYATLTAGSWPNEQEPLMLTTDIDEALAMSPPAAGWGASRCGAVLRSVAVVEFVSVPTHVTVVQGQRHHVLIKDASCMQISYLLIYGQSYQAYALSVEQPCKRVLKWVDANRYTLSLGLYVLGLSLVSRTGRGFFRNFAQTGFQYLKRGLLKI